MTNDHRGAYRPIRNLATGLVETARQNHGFVVDGESLTAAVAPTHVSLFDGNLSGLRLEGKPVFSVRFHPEASPGPQDSHHYFFFRADFRREAISALAPTRLPSNLRMGLSESGAVETGSGS